MRFQSNWKVLITFIFYYLINTCVYSLRIANPNLRIPPKILLAGYVEPDTVQVASPDEKFIFQNQYQTDFLSKNGTDYVASDGINQIIFTCQAIYPITWTFPFPEQLPYTALHAVQNSEYRTSVFLPGFKEPANTNFKILIVVNLQLIQFLSVNLTCKSVEHQPELQSSVHIYLDGKSDLENEGQTLNITYTPNQTNPLTLPCRPSAPEIQLLLEVQYQTGKKEWTHITDWQFDPKIGFTFADSKKLGSRLYTLYRCSVITNDANGILDNVTILHNFVYFNVTSSSNVAPNSNEIFQPTSILHGNASAEMVTIQSGKQVPVQHVKCCSGVKGKPPLIYAQNCITALQCQLQKMHTFSETLKQLVKVITRQLKKAPNDPNGCSMIPVHFPAILVVCKGDNVNFMEEYNQVFHPGSAGLVDNRSARIPSGNNSQKPEVVSLTQYVPVSTVVPVTQKMMIFVGRRINETTVQQSHSAKLGPVIIFQQQATKPLANKQRVENIKELLGNPNDILNRYSIKIVEYDRDEYYEGEKLVFLCVGAKIFYARGPHLRLNWKNGSKTVLETGDDDDITIPGTKLLKLFFLSGGDSMFRGIAQNTEFVFGKTVVAHKDMSSVDCWMPKVGSWKWDTISKTVKVLPSMAPRFLDPEEETVYFHLGEKNNKLSCTFLAGVPPPTLTVLRDGKIVPLNYNKNNVTHKSSQLNNQQKNQGETEAMGERRVDVSLDFSDIQHEHQGKLECIVQNVNKTVRRTVHVYVVARPSVALPIAVGIAGVLSLILVGLGLKRWYDLRFVQMCRPTPVSTAP